MAISHGSWQPIDRVGLNQRINETSTTQKHLLGERVKCCDMGSTAYGCGEFIYLKGVADTIVGSAAVFDLSDGTTALTVAASNGPMGIAMSANVANQYGWYQIHGIGVVDCATVADNGEVYTTGTAGELDDLQADGQQVIGALFRTADDTGLAKIQLNYPLAGADDQVA